MADDDARGSPWTAASDAWTITGTLLAGILVWGGVGYLIDRLAGFDGLFLPIGMVLGLGVAIYLVYIRYGRREDRGDS